MMDRIADFFLLNLDIVYGVYGLAFFIMGTAIFINPRKESRFKLAGLLTLLGFFGLTHGVSEWLEMLAILKGSSYIFEAIETLLLLVSFILLFEFGRRLIMSTTGRLSWRFTFFTLAVFSAACFIPHTQPIILVRYFFAFPGGLITLLGLVLYYRHDKESIRSPDMSRYFIYLSGAIFAYGILTGLVVPEENFFPASVLNFRTFMDVTHIPVVVYRGMCAIVAAWACAHILLIFNIESKERLAKTLEESQSRGSIIASMVDSLIVISPEQKILYVNDSLLRLLGFQESELLNRHPAVLFCPGDGRTTGCPDFSSIFSKDGRFEGLRIELMTKDGGKVPVVMSMAVVKDSRKKITGIVCVGKEIREIKKMEEEIELRNEMRSILNDLIRMSIENTPLEKILDTFIGDITSVAWLHVEKKGAVFITDPVSNVLVMRSQRGLDPDLLSACGRIPFGKCLCGRAAKTGEVTFSDSVDDRHEIKYEGMPPHGHYCVPIHYSGKVLGVISLYMKEGAKRDERKEEFLKSIADVLASIINHSRTEEILRTSEEKYRTLVEQIPAITYITALDEDDNKSLVYVSPQVHKILGFTPEEYMADPNIWSTHLHPEDRIKTISTMISANVGERPFKAEYRILSKDNHEVWVRNEAVTFKDSKGKNMFVHGVMYDITERKKAEAMIEDMNNELERRVKSRTNELITTTELLKRKTSECVRANEEQEKVIIGLKRSNRVYQRSSIHDITTGLFNSQYFMKALRQEFNRARRLDQPLSIILIDIDHFKAINDAYGKAAGDRILKQFAGILKHELREYDSAVRYNGEEFVVLSLGTDEKGAYTLAQRLHEYISGHAFG